MSEVEANTKARTEFIQFLRDYTQLMSSQMEQIRSDMETALQCVMASAMDLSAESQDYKAKAEKFMEGAYLNPDKETGEQLKRVQDEVDRFIEKTYKNKEVDLDHAVAGFEVGVIRARISEKVSGFERLDDSLQDLLCQMMAALSVDDVVGHKIKNVQLCINALKNGINNLLTDPKERVQQQQVVNFRKNLLAYTLKTYSSTEERQVFRKYFQVVEKKSA